MSATTATTTTTTAAASASEDTNDVGVTKLDLRPLKPVSAPFNPILGFFDRKPKQPVSTNEEPVLDLGNRTNDVIRAPPSVDWQRKKLDGLTGSPEPMITSLRRPRTNLSTRPAVEETQTVTAATDVVTATVATTVQVQIGQSPSSTPSCDDNVGTHNTNTKMSTSINGTATPSHQTNVVSIATDKEASVSIATSAVVVTPNKNDVTVAEAAAEKTAGFSEQVKPKLVQTEDSTPTTAATATTSTSDDLLDEFTIANVQDAIRRMEIETRGSGRSSQSLVKRKSSSSNSSMTTVHKTRSQSSSSSSPSTMQETINNTTNNADQIIESNRESDEHKHDVSQKKTSEKAVEKTHAENVAKKQETQANSTKQQPQQSSNNTKQTQQKEISSVEKQLTTNTEVDQGSSKTNDKGTRDKSESLPAQRTNGVGHIQEESSVATGNEYSSDIEALRGKKLVSSTKVKDTPASPSKVKVTSPTTHTTPAVITISSNASDNNSSSSISNSSSGVIIVRKTKRQSVIFQVKDPKSKVESLSKAYDMKVNTRHSATIKSTDSNSSSTHERINIINSQQRNTNQERKKSVTVMKNITDCKKIITEQENAKIESETSEKSTTEAAAVKVASTDLANETETTVKVKDVKLLYEATNKQVNIKNSNSKNTGSSHIQKNQTTTNKGTTSTSRETATKTVTVKTTSEKVVDNNALKPAKPTTIISSTKTVSSTNQTLPEIHVTKSHEATATSSKSTASISVNTSQPVINQPQSPVTLVSGIQRKLSYTNIIASMYTEYVTTVNKSVPPSQLIIQNSTQPAISEESKTSVSATTERVNVSVHANSTKTNGTLKTESMNENVDVTSLLKPKKDSKSLLLVPKYQLVAPIPIQNVNGAKAKCETKTEESANANVDTTPLLKPNKKTKNLPYFQPPQNNEKVAQSTIEPTKLLNKLLKIAPKQSNITESSDNKVTADDDTKAQPIDEWLPVKGNTKAMRAVFEYMSGIVQQPFISVTKVFRWNVLAVKPLQTSSLWSY